MLFFFVFLQSENRRGVRVAERACLESMCTRKGTAGSNPALSAQENRTVGQSQCRFFIFELMQVNLQH